MPAISLPSHVAAPPKELHMDDDAVVTYEQLSLQFGIDWSRTHIDRLEKAGKFPRRLKTSKARGARFFYRIREIRAWLNALKS
jgi:predicted DNA-binding transcriptional regulator AlpA